MSRQMPWLAVGSGLAAAGLVISILLILSAILAPWLAPDGPWK